MSDLSSRLPARPSLEQLRKQAKELVRLYRAADPVASARFETVFARAAKSTRRPVSLADAQFVLAREHHFETWIALKRHVASAAASKLDPYEKLAADVVLACRDNDQAAVYRLGELFGGHLTTESIHNRVLLRLNTPAGPVHTSASVTLADARLFVARLYGFESWDVFEASILRPRKRTLRPVHGLSLSPPFYKIDRESKVLEAWPPLFPKDWEQIFDAMRNSRITGLRAAGQMTDAALARLAQSGEVTALYLDGCRHVTDEGLQHLARMPHLQRLSLSGCGITDRGLAVLRLLPELREFSLQHHWGLTDEGLANLSSCEKLERVDLLGSPLGDAVLRAMAGKQHLRHLKSGTRVTDAGLPFLHEIPAFKTWQGGTPDITLMRFHQEPNHLLLRGAITDRGMTNLVGLDGLFSLNIDDSKLALSETGLRSLARLPNLGCLAFDATDQTMEAIANLPHLRLLMCQDTSAGDRGFIHLSRSRTLEYIWGRRCHNLAGAGFRAISQMPSMRGLSVSCRNVDDDALSTLPDFPSLVEFMPMDVPDHGFRHISRCRRLEAVWCMYCRDTGDIATEHLSHLPGLKTYYAGQTLITDRSLQILSRMPSLENLTFAACKGVTNAGVAALSVLPRLRNLTLELLPGVTRDALLSIAPRVRISFES